QELDRATQLQQAIWSKAVTETRSDSTAAKLLLPAVNAMIDVTTLRTIALRTHLPRLIFGLLISAALFSGLLAGFSMARRKSRSWPHILVYALVVAFTVYTVVDLDYPRSGLIRIDAADHALHTLRDSIR